MVVLCVSGAPSPYVPCAHTQEPRLLISDPVAMDHVLCRRAYAYPKVRVVRRMLSGIMGEGMLVAEGETHRRQKRACQPGFSQRTVRGLAPVFDRHAHALRRYLEECAEDKPATLDLYALMAYTALDTLGSAAFHIEFGSLANARAKAQGRTQTSHPLTAAFDRAMDVMTQNSIARNVFDAMTMLFPILEYVPIGVASLSLRRASRVLFDVAEEIVAEAKTSVTPSGGAYRNVREKDERKDLLASLLRANANAHKPSKGSVLDHAVLDDAELAAQLSTFIFAGHETTSTQMTWLILMLAQHPHVQTKLRAEIRAARAALQLAPQSAADAHDEFRDLSMEELATLPYLDACVRESLRLHGVIHTTSRMAAEPDVIPTSDGRRIVVEADTVVMIPLAAIAQDPVLWGKDAHLFRPERWEAPMDGATLFPAVGGVAFLQGPRGCIGRQFGTLPP